MNSLSGNQLFNQIDCGGALFSCYFLARRWSATANKNKIQVEEVEVVNNGRTESNAWTTFTCAHTSTYTHSRKAKFNLLGRNEQKKQFYIPLLRAIFHFDDEKIVFSVASASISPDTIFHIYLFDVFPILCFFFSDYFTWINLSLPVVIIIF